MKIFSWTEADPFRIKAERTSVTGWTDEGGGGRVSELELKKEVREHLRPQWTVSGV